MPKFKDVPANWKHPLGPYRQAPAEFGGEWWLVNPFTSEEPWLNQAGVVKTYPEGFLETFGPRPVLSEFRGLPNPREAHQLASGRWDTDLKYFTTAGWPDWVPPHVIQSVKETALAYGMGTPRPYIGRYDHRVRFPESLIRDFEDGLFGVQYAFHQTVARYQTELVEDFGIVPEKRHPFVPPQVWPADEKTEKLIAEVQRRIDAEKAGPEKLIAASKPAAKKTRSTTRKVPSKRK